MPFTEEHDKFILEAYFRTGTPDKARNCTYSYQNCEEQFRKQFPDVHYRYTTFQQHCRRVVKRFKKTGSVTKGKTRGRPTLLTERVVDDIRQRIAEGPKKSLRALSAQTNLSLGTVQKACKRALRLHTDKVTVTQELQPPDLQMLNALL